MRHLLDLYKEEEVRDDFNAVGSVTLSFLDHVWAEILESSNEQQFVFDGEVVVANRVFKTRYDPLITDKVIIKHNDKHYRVIGLDNEKELNRFYIIYVVSYNVEL